MAVGERFELGPEAAVWLSARGLGSCEVLAQVGNDWLDQQTAVGIREWHRALEQHARRREEVA